MYASIVAVALSTVSLTSAAIAPPNACPPSTVSVRLPPYVDPALNSNSSSLLQNSSSSSSFLAPDLNFYPGTWYLTNTSRAAYRALSNLQWDLWPVLPSCEQNSTASCPPGTVSGTLVDLSTWVHVNSSTSGNSSNSNSSADSFSFGAIGGGGRPVDSIRGYDTPLRLQDPSLGPAWDGAWENHTPGIFGSGYSERWSVLFWGVDAKGVPFMIVHEAVGSGPDSPPCVDAWSRSQYGPEAGSLANVMEALMELGNADLTSLVQQMGAVKWDYELQGGAAICGESCQQNKAE